jgi:signal transduction histidine kinase
MRQIAFVASALVTGTLGFALLLAGWLAVGLLAVTPLVVPAAIAFRYGVGALARLEASLARSLLGAEVSPGGLTSGGSGYWGRGAAVARDRTFWQQHGYVLARTAVGWPLAVGVVALLGGSLWLIGLPIGYRFVNEDFGVVHVDSLQKALLVVPVGVIGVVVSLLSARGLAALWRRGAELLLGPPRVAFPKLLKTHALLTVLANAVVLVVWAATPHGQFWPKWVMIGTGLPLALHAGRGVNRKLLALAVFEVLVWAFAGGGYFWPGWSFVGFAVAAAVVAIARYQRGGLEQRIEVLETTRAGAVDVQESELRRIERDLHDGAQARLVALGMNLGMAEQKLAADPDAARGLVAEARAGVEEALRELRDLARGIHPPVLADRGLEAAIEALAHRSAVPVGVHAAIGERPSAAVETAAYFVAAEAMTNAAKHAAATRIDVSLSREPGALVVEVCDDGKGGADPSGSGLTGLRHRVEALDGTLSVESPSGRGTTLRAELPCVS